MPESTKRVPRIVERIVTTYEWRHVRGIARVRALVAVWLVTLGIIACATDHWWGAFLFVAAGLVGWLAVQVPRWKLALDAEKTVRPDRDRS